MREGRLSVFDGLRLTTEHFEHFQKAIHLALRDLRLIAGLGKVYSGFQVERANEKSVMVQPGLAFDFQSNQIVSDEPTAIEVEFGPSQETLYLCIEYDQVSTDPVEGRPTLLWDGCSINLRPDLPPRADNQIAIARLDKQPQDASHVFDLISLGDGSANPSEGGSEPKTSASELTAPGILTPVADSTSLSNVKAYSAPAIGTLKLGGELDTSALLGKVQEILKEPLSVTAVSTTERTLLVLGEPELTVPFPLACITLHLVVTAEFVLPGSASADISVVEADRPPAPERLCVQITAHAEATRTDAVQQHSVSTTHLSGPILAGQKTNITADVDDAGILKFRFGQLRGVRESTMPDMLEHIVLRIALKSEDNSSLRLSCLLVWDHEPSPTGRDVSAMNNFGVSWSIQALWKAIAL